MRPQQVDLRSAWKREDQDFTPWLADNLDFLEDVGLGDLELLGTEVAVPGVGRRLDIMATTADDRRVAIENQYRSIDHDHLTRGLAYAVGLQADALVVIAEGHGEEFVAVADYLNSCAESAGAGGISIFLVALRLETLGEYFVPRFEVVSRPNEWRAAINRDLGGQALDEAAERRKVERRKFWEEFLVAAQNGGSTSWANSNPVVGSYLSAQALSGVNVAWTITVRADSCSPVLWLDAGDSELNNNLLYEIRDRYRSAGHALAVEWTAKDGARACSVDGPSVDDCGWRTDSEARSPQLSQVVEQFDEFKKTLQPLLDDAYRHLTLG